MTATRPPDYIHALALTRLEEMMIAARPWSSIVRTLTDEKFLENHSDPEQTAVRWRQAVQQRWRTEDVEMRPARKDLWRARLENLYGQLLEQALAAKSEFARSLYFGEAIKIAKLSIDLDGLSAPIAVRHEGRLDVAAMSPSEREAEIKMLLAKREAARAAAAGGGN
ncbi:MAG TPA: hypothetical protein VLN57_21035 [Xanthobacteraceae bacterium]|nr:hypothetical protein [Xanthobacteraceae bacterium]